MKNKSYANRGQPLEGFVKFANSRYRQKRIAHIEKQNTEFIPIRNRSGKVVGCKVEEKATFDFLGRYKNHPIAIEAKNTEDGTIRWDRIEANQADDMDNFTSEPGTIGLVLVSFGLKRFFAVPWVFWQAAYNARVRPGASRTAPVTVEAFGEAWEVPRKNSARVEDLSPLWEVSGNDHTYGLHYLANAEKYITPPQP